MLQRDSELRECVMPIALVGPPHTLEDSTSYLQLGSFNGQLFVWNVSADIERCLSSHLHDLCIFVTSWVEHELSKRNICISFMILNWIKLWRTILNRWCFYHSISSQYPFNIYSISWKNCRTNVFITNVFITNFNPYFKFRFNINLKSYLI